MSKEEIDVMDYGDESDDDPMSTEMLEDILDGSQFYHNVNRRKVRCRVRVRINQRQSE